MEDTKQKVQKTMFDTMLADVKAEQRAHKRIVTAISGIESGVALRAIDRVREALIEARYAKLDRAEEKNPD